jgi:hypothetical protein
MIDSVPGSWGTGSRRHNKGEDRHEFTVGQRHQSTRPDVRLPKRTLSARGWIAQGRTVTPSRSTVQADELRPHRS